MGKRAKKTRFLLILSTLFCLLGLFAPKQSHATHIVGADLFYECLGTGNLNYRVTLRFLRDCSPGSYHFDDPIYLYLIPVTAPSLRTVWAIPLPADTLDLQAEGWDICVGPTNDPCIREAVYRRVIEIEPRNGGYYLAWARCCRNDLITNLDHPLDEGATWIAKIPGPEAANCNSMPRFKNDLPIFLCAGRTFYLDHGATDANSDSLVYSLSTPYGGLNFQGIGAGNGTFPGPMIDPNNPVGPPPYLNVVYASSAYNGQNPFGPGSASIDPVTGWLMFNPPDPGVFLVAVTVKEYRNGILLSENKRDWQIHVVNCLQPDPPPLIAHDLSGLTTIGDTIIVNANEPFCYDVIVTDSNQFDVLYAQAISTVFSANPFPPSPTLTFSGTNPLNVEICWSPSCDYIDQTVALILTGWDDEDCPHYNHVFDTVWVHIIPPPNTGPLILHDFSSVASWNGDTIFMQVDSTECFDWNITDTISTGNLAYSWALEKVSGGSGLGPVTTVLATFPDSISLRTCFTATCNDMGGLFRMIMNGENESGCPPSNVRSDTIFILVELLPNPPPVVLHNLNGNIFTNDTIFAEVHDNFCYTFSVNDTFPGVGLNYQFNISAVDGNTVGGPAPVVSIISQGDSLVGQVCWTANCDNVGRMFLLTIQGIQNNRCNQNASAADSVYIVVNPDFNPPPILTYNFPPGANTIGDTIFITPDSLACFDFVLRDTAQPTHLTFSSVIELVSSGNATGQPFTIDYTVITDTNLSGSVCFTPGCEFVNELLRVVLTGIDTFNCDPANIVHDTLYVRVIEPFNNPPTIAHDLSGLDVQGGVVQVNPTGEEYCYTVVVNDPDSLFASLTAEGVNDIFNSNWGFGNNATIQVTGSNPLFISVCWNPSCYDELKDFTLRICGRDTSRCALTPEVCDEVSFHVGDCTFEVENVFSPNGDGVNETFLPFDQNGVQYFTMLIYDRWGKNILDVVNEPWDGKFKDKNEVPAGVYYYVVHRQYWSAKGAPLDDDLVGWVTLIR